jgi:hypothetical protein
MRLTLRTLLAYLDDTLEPGQARLIGEKVAESDAAQELIARIKQVTRRRRLTTPPAAGEGAKLDINKIAAYLDNELPPEQLAEVEEICLASDVHLAEIAACHQILTLVLGEPILIPPTARQRMYTLIKGREAIPNRAARATGIGKGARELSEVGRSGETGIPGATSADSSGRRWLLPVAAGGLLLVAMVALALVMNSGQPTFVARNEVSSPAEPPVARAPEAKPADAELPPPAEPSKIEPAKSPAPATEPKPKPSPPPETKLPAEKTVVATEKKSEVARTRESATPAALEKPPAVPERILPPANDRLELGKYVLAADGPSVFLQRTRGSGPWQRLRPQSPVFSSDYLTSLPGYRSELWLDGGARLQLWGSLPELAGMPIYESAVTLHPRAGVDVDFTLERGVVVLSNHKKQGPMVARVRFADEAWDVTLPDSDSIVGVHLHGRCMPFSRQPDSGEPNLIVVVLALRGPSTVQVRYSKVPLSAPSFFGWNNIQGPAQEPQHLPQPPDWWTNKPPSQSPLQAALQDLTRRLLAKQQDNSLEIVLAEMINDRESADRAVAVRCMGAMNDWPDLLDALSSGLFPDVRALACGELYRLLGLNRANDDILAAALRQKNFSEGQARTVVQLLHRFAPELWGNLATRTTTVEYLAHDKLAIRQLAYLLLLDQIPEGKKIPYDPAGDIAMRQRGYLAWRDLVSGNRPNGKPAAKDKGVKK